VSVTGFFKMAYSSAKGRASGHKKFCTKQSLPEKINGQPANITFTSKMAIIPVTAIASVNKMTLQTGKLYYHTAHEKQTVHEFSPT